MSILPKSLREKNRYIALKIRCDVELERNDVVNALVKSQLDLYGQVGAADQNMWVMDYDEKTVRAIVKCKHKSVREVKSAAIMISKIKGKPASLEVIKTCGTLKTARKYLEAE